MKILEFVYPTFHAGVNLTVRVGANVLGVVEGEQISLAAAGSRPFGEAVVFKSATMSFDEIPDCWLPLEHVPECRTREGLLDAMVQVYGEEFDRSQVTCLFFIPVDLTLDSVCRNGNECESN